MNLSLVDESYHASLRTWTSLVGTLIFALVVMVISAVGWLPLPKAPVIGSLAVFSLVSALAAWAFHRRGFQSKAYRYLNYLESEVVFVGLALAMAASPDPNLVLSSFYLIMGVMQSQATGATAAGILSAVLPVGLTAIYQVQTSDGDAWHVPASTALVSAFLYFFVGKIKEDRVAVADEKATTERRLAVATMQLEAERRLHAIERDWIATLQHSASALYLFDAGDVLQRVADETGYALDAAAPESRSLVNDLRQAAAEARGKREVVSLFSVNLPSGRFVDIRLVALPGSDRVAVLVQDVSERVELETRNKALLDRVALADKMASIGILAAGVAHEINNPLTYISGNIEYVLGNTALEESVRAPLLDVQLGFHQIERIVTDLKTFSHTRPSEVGEVFDLAAVCERTERMVAKEFRHVARLEVSLPDKPVWVFGFADRIQQVILNLLINARQALPERPAAENLIRLRLAECGSEAAVEVEDNGAGIPQENLRRIFDPFYTTKAPGVGTGLGLSVSYQIAKEHQGRIDVRSTPGEGTTFTLTLPVRATSTSRPRVLVIDDEERNLKLFARVFKNYEVVTAMGIASAVPLLSGVLHAVLCDVRLADGTGFDAYRKAPTNLKSRFVFLTALPPDSAELKNTPAGVRVLHKPIPLERLEHELNAVIFEDRAQGTG